MYLRICVFILLAANSSLSLTSQAMTQKTQSDTSLHTRQARSVAAPPAGQLASYNQPREEEGSNLSQLLARLLSRKGHQTRSSLSSRASGPGPAHRIEDRDYLGWMDFGRRSAEEYDYSS